MNLLVAMEVFTRVARQQSFSAAARDLRMSRTAASRHVSDLEHSLGTRLLNRTTRRVSLTEAGRAYADRSAVILTEIEELQHATQNLSRNPVGVLRVTAAVTFGHFSLMPHISGFLSEYPDIKLQLYLTNRFVDIVEEGYDLALRIADPPDSSLISRKLLSAKMHLCAAPRYIERSGRLTTPDDLTSHCCVTYLTASGGNVWRFSDSMRDYAVPIAGRFQVNSVEAAISAVRDGVGIGLIPDFAIANELACGGVQQLLGGYDTGEIQTYAIYPHKLHLSAKVRVFVDYLIESLGTVR